MELKEIVLGYKDEMVANLAKLVSYNSVSEGDENTPFGQPVTDCLNEALKMCESYGFKTKNLDNYCGYAEVGQGEQLIGIMGHLDVVPAGDGWTTDPFTAVVKDGKMYGRGTTDDKGPVISGMVAMKVVSDLHPNMNKRIRLIMGCNEERGSRCLAHYVQEEGHVDYGFTPDGNFPAIHGEKGGMGIIFKSKKTNILNIKGGTVGNAVAKNCDITVAKGSFDEEKFAAYLAENGLTYEKEEAEAVTLHVHGRAAHASMPELGINSVTHGLTALKAAGYEDEFVEFFCNKIGTDYHGKNMGLNVEDAYGPLTFCVGTIRMEEGVIIGTIDCRVPVTVVADDLKALFDKANDDERGILECLRIGRPLFYKPEGDLVNALVSAYQEVTGCTDEEAKPLVIGGGTYAKGIKNTIAFGPEYPGKDYHIHDADEFIDLDEFVEMTVIYIRAIEKLLEL